MKIQKLTTAALMTAIGVTSAHIIYIPMGVAKTFPMQHAINLLCATLLGPGYAVAVAFSISVLRNLLGVGSLLAFPGSMIGALLAGLLYQKTKKVSLAVMGELFGTGIIGGLVSYPVATYLMGREAALFFYVGPFLLSSLTGVIIGTILFSALRKLSIFNNQGVR